MPGLLPFGLPPNFDPNSMITLPIAVKIRRQKRIHLKQSPLKVKSKLK